MRLLIVDVDMPLAEATAEVLRWVDQAAGCIETISLAGDLETAIRLLSQNDAVLCDGRFTISPDSLRGWSEWDVLRREALRCGIHFVLYGGCPHVLDVACRNRTPAIAKPANMEEIYAALGEHFVEPGFRN